MKSRYMLTTRVALCLGYLIRVNRHPVKFYGLSLKSTFLGLIRTSKK